MFHCKLTGQNAPEWSPVSHEEIFRNTLNSSMDLTGTREKIHKEQPSKVTLSLESCCSEPITPNRSHSDNLQACKNIDRDSFQQNGSYLPTYLTTLSRILLE
jgi:hypothetical protein